MGVPIGNVAKSIVAISSAIALGGFFAVGKDLSFWQLLPWLGNVVYYVFFFGAALVMHYFILMMQTDKWDDMNVFSGSDSEQMCLAFLLAFLSLAHIFLPMSWKGNPVALMYESYGARVFAACGLFWCVVSLCSLPGKLFYYLADLVIDHGWSEKRYQRMAGRVRALKAAGAAADAVKANEVEYWTWVDEIKQRAGNLVEQPVKEG